MNSFYLILNPNLNLKDSIDHNGWLRWLNDYDDDELQHLTHRFAKIFGNDIIEGIECVDSGPFNNFTEVERLRLLGETLVELRV